jgi:hypothetical protein
MPVNDGMFMILGSPRSGTTLLAQTISAHPDLIVPQETDFIPFAALTLCAVPDSKVGLKLISEFLKHSELTRTAFREYFDEASFGSLLEGARYDASAVVQIFRRLALRTGKAFAGDKSPDNLLNIRAMDNAGLLEPPIRIVHIVRDIRDVMASLKQDLPHVWAGGLERIMPRIWADSNLYLVSRLSGRKNYLRISYEDFVTEPLPVLGRICDFLGVASSTLMLDVERRSPALRAMPQHRNLARGIGNFSIGRYRRDFNSAEIALFERPALEAMVRFGYDPVSVPESVVRAVFEESVAGLRS